MLLAIPQLSRSLTRTPTALTGRHPRAYSTSYPTKDALRALVYSQHGDPSSVLRSTTFKPLPCPSSTQVRLKILLSPINPADINVIQGVYPSRPLLLDKDSLTPVNTGEGLYIAGSEAVGVVTEVGNDAGNELRVGDRVIVDKSQAGVWATSVVIDAKDVMKVNEGLSDVAAATMRINPPTALGMLRSFVDLQPGDWVIQNGANSAVGQAVIQIAAALGLKTINLVRDRPDLDTLKSKLVALGANHVWTYGDMADKFTKPKVKELTGGGKSIRLGLNCVGGRDTTIMAGYLGHDAHLVSYGAMSKQPLSLPTSLFIFKNLTSHGYWQSRWYDTHDKPQREAMLKEIGQFYSDKKLREPDHEITELKGDDDQVSQTVAEAMKKLSGGGHGKKVLLKWA